MTREAQVRSSVTTYKGVMGKGMGRKFRRKDTCVHLWLIHTDVWQEPMQYCEAIIL